MNNETLSGWAMWSPYQGLMWDFYSSRRAAIIDFLWKWDESDRERRPYYPGKMTAQERRNWNKRRREGFKPVKVTLSMKETQS